MPLLNFYKPGTREGVVIGIFMFAIDWSGYDRYQPSLFMGVKSLGAIWWHLPLEIAVMVVLANWWSGTGRRP